MTDRPALPPAAQVAYGDHPDQCGNLHLPAGEGPWPAVVLVHGGYWRWGWDRTLMTPLARDLARRGIVAWNIEYRRVGQVGGGWPATFEDVALAVDALAGIEHVEAERVAVVGHSAGGHLALWAAARAALPDGAPGTDPLVEPVAIVGQAAVSDLVAAAHDGLGRDATPGLLGGSPEELPERYGAASPAALLPLGVPQLLVHGTADANVPVSQSEAFAAAAAAAGDRVELRLLPGADHFALIDADGEAWAETAAWLEHALGVAG